MELAGDWDGVAKVTLDAAKRLQASGAEGVIITSNTGHKVFDAVAANIDVPMLHIGDAAADRLVADRQARVALLGTRFTMTEGHVREPARSAAAYSSRRSMPHGSTRSIASSSTSSLPAASSATAQRKLKTLITELAKQKVQAVVLGCTELVLAVDVRANVLPVYDTTAIHARAAFEWMLAEEEEARAAAVTSRAGFG